MQKENTTASSTDKWLLILVVFTILFRGGVLFISPQSIQMVAETFFVKAETIPLRESGTVSLDADPDRYAALAKNLQQYGVFGDKTTPTAFRPPLYPFLLRQAWRLSFETPIEQEAVQLDESEKAAWCEQFLLSRVAATALLHWILGVLTVVFVYQTAKELGILGLGPFVAALFVAVDPILLQQSRLVMTETLAAFFSALLLLMLVQYSRVPTELGNQGIRQLGWLGFIGIVLGLATLCRPTFLLFAIFIALGILLGRKEKQLGRGRFAIVPCAMLILGTLLVLIPWAIRNERHFGKPILTTTHDGYTLLLANNSFLYETQAISPPWEKLWDPTDFHQWYNEQLASELCKYSTDSNSNDRFSKPLFQQLSILQVPYSMADAGETPAFPGDTLTLTAKEWRQNEWAKAVAIQTINDQPMAFIRASLFRFGQLWQCLPYRTEEGESLGKTAIRWFIAGFYSIELFFAFLGASMMLLRYRRQTKEEKINTNIQWYYSPWLWGFLLILSIQLPHLFFWTNMRMRAPLMVFLPLVTLKSIFHHFERTDERQGIG